MIRAFTGHTINIRCIAVAPDSRRAISGSVDSTIRLWDLGTGECLRTLTGHTNSVQSVAIGPGGRRARSGGYDGAVRLWDLETGREIGRFVREGRPRGYIYSVVFMPDGRRILASGGVRNVSWRRDSELRLWRVPTDLELWAWRLMDGKPPDPPKREK